MSQTRAFTSQRAPRTHILWCRRRLILCRCVASKDGRLNPVEPAIAAWAPATIANLGPGFDWMGCAVNGEGDTVTALVDESAEPGRIRIEQITGDGGRLSLEPDRNCIGIAARETLRLLPAPPACGIALRLHKGLPLGSGMGSSAASAAAACWAVNLLFGSKLRKEELVFAGLQSEAAVSGYHADNIAPALMGGFVLVRSAEPLDLLPLAFEGKAYFVLVNPKFEAPTREMRAALPAEVPFKQMLSNSVAGGSLVAGILTADVELMGRALGEETVIEAARGPLIPGFAHVKQAAMDAGAYGCTISGAGPTVVAVVGSDAAAGRAVGEAMSKAFQKFGGLETNSVQVVELDREGVRRVDVPLDATVS